MAADYVSPFDERVRAAEPLAPRPASVLGQHAVLLDIRKNRGASGSAALTRSSNGLT